MTALHLFEQHRPGVRLDVNTLLAPARAEQPDTTLNCAQCAYLITAPAERIEVNAHHAHTFTNPHGLTFHIGCFAGAPGVIEEGAALDAWSWFPGYRWQIALCRGCGLHLGWRYTGDGGGFYGLILNRLVERLR